MVPPYLVKAALFDFWPKTFQETLGSAANTRTIVWNTKHYSPPNNERQIFRADGRLVAILPLLLS
jgi:hypothetical protein